MLNKMATTIVIQNQKVLIKQYLKILFTFKKYLVMICYNYGCLAILSNALKNNCLRLNKQKLILLCLFCLLQNKVLSQTNHYYLFNSGLSGNAGAPMLQETLACGASPGSVGMDSVYTSLGFCTYSNVFCFNHGGGLQYPNSISGDYTISVLFKFTESLTGYTRIIDFSNSTSDAGVYLLNNCLNLYPNGNVGTCPYFQTGVYYYMTFVKDASTGIIQIYVDGVLFGSYTDVSNIYSPTPGSFINFFRDDNAVGCEAKAGCVKYISINSQIATPADIQTAYNTICDSINSVPEICDNGIDDDADGLIDLNDTECSCSPLTVQPPSMIPNNSFEQMNCCPTSFSQLSCATGWIQASGATSDYYNCAYNNTINTPATPYPDGPGYMGFWDLNNGFGTWKEYIGSCLLSPMLAGQTYTLTFSIAVGHGTDGAIPPYPPLNFTIFGTPNCSALPWAGTDCPTGSWTPLVSQLIPTSAPNPSPIPWQTVTVSFTPAININAIAVGPSCGSVSNSYSYIDNLVLNQTTSFNASIQEIGGWCTNNLQLFSPDAPLGTYQWYKDGIALLGEINDTLNLSLGAYPDGYYTLKIDSGGTCYIVSGTVAPAAPPVASFSATNLCFGSVTSFADLSTVATGGIVGWDWDAGDGIGFSSAQNPTYTYNAPGIYTVTLIVTSSQGCKDTVSGTGTVFEPPVASFTATTVCVGSTIVFTDASTSTVSTIVGWNWDAGDGVGTATIQNPQYVYANAGTYNATLTVTDNNGCTDDTTIAVSVVSPPATPVTCAGNVLVNSSFENPVVPVLNGNNIVGASIPGWNTQFGGSFNVIKVNGSAYAAGADNAATGNQYVDIVNSSDYPTQSFTLTRTSILSFSGYFSNRESANGGYIPWTGKVDILDAANTIVASSNTFNFTSAFGNENWVYLSGVSTPLPAGTYRYRAFISDYGHFDEAFLCITPSVCEGDTIFLNASTIAGVTYSWTGPNSFTSTQQNPVIPNATPAMTGTYTVTASVPLSSCSGSQAFTTIVVEPKPTVSVPSNITVCNTATVAATNFTSNYAGALFNWTNDNPAIGIGASGTGNIPQFNAVNNTANPIIATITVTPSVSNSPCYGIPATYTITINPTPTVTVPINNNVCVGASVAATNFTSTTAGSTFDWTNSNTAIGLSASGNGNIPAFTAANTTTNPITTPITVTPTANGCVGTASTYTITVDPAPAATFSFNNVCLGSSTSFTDLSNPNGGIVSNWNWDLGNSNSSINQNPTELYTTDGTYNVTLIVTTNNNCKDTIMQTVNVWPLPVVDFTPTEVCLNEATQFNDLSMVSVGANTTWNWNFNDGTPLNTNQNPVHTYTNGGLYQAQLTVTTNNGCIDSVTKPVTINPLPQVNFSASALAGCAPLIVNFNDSSTIAPPGSNVSWFWDFGNGLTSTLQNPNGITYLNPSNTSPISFGTSLIVVSDKGCSTKDSIINMITSYPVPFANFLISPSPTDIYSSEITFTDNSVIASQWLWDLGDGTSSILQNPAHLYADSGTYNIILYIQNIYSCKDTAQNPVRINPVFVLWIPNAFTPDGDQLNDYFTVKGYGIKELQLLIFNRWGELLFESYDTEPKWDGTYKNELVKQDVYIYKLEVKDIFNQTHYYVGHVTVIK